MKIIDELFNITEVKKVEKMLSKKGYNASTKEYINSNGEIGYIVTVTIDYNGMYRPKSWYDELNSLRHSCKKLFIDMSGYSDTVHIFKNQTILF